MSIFDKISGRFGDLIDEVRIPEELHRIHEEATLALTRGDASNALTLLVPSLTRYPNIQRSHVLIARAYKLQGHWRPAVEACERAIEIRDQATLRLMAAELYLDHRHLKEAFEHLQKAAGLPDGVAVERDLAYTLAKVYLAQEQLDRAERELRRCMRIDPSNLQAAHALATLIARHNVSEAREILVQADSRKSDPTTRLLLAGLLESEGDFDQALTLAADSLPPEDPRVALTIGRILTKLDRPEDALNALAAGSPTNDHYRIEFAYLRGQCELALQRWESARREFNAALSLKPDLPEALVGLGEAELALNHPEVASGFFLQAMQTSHRGSAMSGVGRSFIARGDKAGGRHFLEEALRETIPPQQRALAHRTLAAILTDPIEILSHLLDASIFDRKTVNPLLEKTLASLKPSFNLPSDLINPMATEALLREVILWVSADPRLLEFIATAQALLNKLESPLSIAVVGEFNAGKSTLLNAILEEDLLPVGVLPTTAHTGIVRFGPRRAARIYWTHQQPEEVTFETAAAAMKDNAAQVQRVDFMFPHPVLRAVEFWDTPGFNALEERHEEVATQALTRAEAILWVMDANQVLSATEFERIDGIRLGAERLIVVINKIDRLGRHPEQQVAELLEYVEENIGDHIAGVFPVSAHEAVTMRSHEPPAFQRFRAFLEDRVFNRAGRIKVLEIHEQLLRMFVTIDAFGKGRTAALMRNQDELKNVRVWLTDDITKANITLIENQRREIEDQLSLMLLKMEHEISDAMRPSGHLMKSLQLPAQDTDFIGRVLLDQFSAVLNQQFRTIEKHLDEQEATLARRLDRLCTNLPTFDSRIFHRGIEGFFDELRSHRALLREKYTFRTIAMAETRIDALVGEVLASLDGDRALWRPRLRRLLPDTSSHTTRALQSAMDDWKTRTNRILDRMERDLRLLEMESAHRYDLSTILDHLDSPDLPS